MKRFRFFRWYNDVSLAKKLYFVMSVIGIFITIGLVALVVSLESLSGIRGYVNGENLWLKSQKDGVYYLSRYALVGNEKDYIAFLQNMQVPLGDKKARLELEKENPDYNIARQGFREGGNHPDDVNSMIELFRRYRNFTYLDQAISIWANGDNEISKLMAVGEQLHREINSASPSEENISILLSQIAPINEKLAVLENRFSETTGHGGRWLEDFVLKTLISIMVIVALTGLVFSVSLNKRIANSINDMILVAKKVANGNFTARALTSSKDELGVMSLSVNRMIANLERQFNEINAVQEKLRIKTKQLDHAQQSAHIGSWEWNVPANSIEWTDELYRILGYEPNEFEPTYNDYLDHIHADDRPKLNDLVMGAFNAGISANIELYHRVSRKDGTERILSGKVNLYGENGVILKMAGTIQDVTETKKSEKALIHKAQQLAEAQELGHFGSWEWNLETGKVEWSDELCRIHGLVPGEQEMTYDLAISFIHPEDRGFLKIPSSRQYEDQHQTDFFYRIIRPDGVVRIINGKGRVFTDSTGKTIRMRGTMQDVTELKKAEAELTYKTLQLNRAQESVHVGSWEWGVDSNNIEWSDELYRIYGLQPQQFAITLSNFSDYIHPNDRHLVLESLKKVYAEQRSGDVQYRILKPGGGERIIYASVDVHTDNGGNTLRLSGTCRDVTEEKKSEQALIFKTQQLDEAQELGHIGSWEWDIETGRVLWSDELYRIHGLKPVGQEITYEQSVNFVHPDDREYVENVGKQQYEDQQQTDIFYRIVRPDGAVRIINGKGKVFTDSTGKNIRMKGTIQDVTELKKTEEELICKTNQLNKAQRSARIGSWEWSAKNDVLEWSEEMYRIYGLTENESVITYETLTKFIHPNDVEYVRNITKKQEQDKHQYNIYYRIIRPDGLELIVNARTEIFTDAKDKTIRASGTIQDVTKEKQIENKLLEFKYFFNTTSDLACISNTEGTFEIVNQSFVDKLGYTKKELTGRAFLSFIHPDDVQATIDVLEALKNGNPYVNLVNRYRTKSGKYLWFDWNATPNLETGKHYRMARDITLQKENEQELIRLKELAETSEKIKDQFLANMSHEIRTPMNAIMGFSDLLTRSSLQEQEKDYVNTIKQAGENLLVIINDILDISKIQAGMMVIEKSDFSIRDSFKSIKALMAVKADPKNIELNFSCAPDVPETVAGDPARFTQIMINLVGNAVKFTPKGKIDVSAEVIENEKHDLRKDEVLIKFCVRDTGIGISADKLGNIFERFRQADYATARNYGGTGLGLSIAKQLVEMQGGQITAESTDKISAAHAETGSVFCFTIPYGKTASAGIKKSDKKKYDFTMLQDINILIVEDNLLNIKLLQHLFKEFKLKSDVAENGRICIQKMQQTAYDIILMDMEMPVLNGYEATEIIRNEMKNKIPIVAMTANAMAGEREKCLSLGMNNYISKPLNAQLLFEMIFDITYNS